MGEKVACGLGGYSPDPERGPLSMASCRLAADIKTCFITRRHFAAGYSFQLRPDCTFQVRVNALRVCGKRAGTNGDELGGMEVRGCFGCLHMRLQAALKADSAPKRWIFKLREASVAEAI